MVTPAVPRITPEEYLENERQAETRSEYLRGEVFAMSVSTLRHTRITADLVTLLRERLAGHSCDVLSSDMRLAVPSRELYTYPDVMVVCGESALANDLEDTMTNPVVIIEVLSKSTKNYDRAEKFQHYRTLQSLRDYLTVSQDEPRIEQHTRQASGQWLLTEFHNLSETLELSSLGVKLTIADIYARVKF